MSVKLEVGELLDIARSFPNLEQFFVAHPRLACKLWGGLMKRTDLFTSHNRMRSGIHADDRCARQLERNKEIIYLAQQVDADDCYIYSHEEIGLKVDLCAVSIGNICRAEGLWRRGGS